MQMIYVQRFWDNKRGNKSFLPVGGEIENFLKKKYPKRKDHSMICYLSGKKICFFCNLGELIL